MTIKNHKKDSSNLSQNCRVTVGNIDKFNPLEREESNCWIYVKCRIFELQQILFWPPSRTISIGRD